MVFISVVDVVLQVLLSTIKLHLLVEQLLLILSGFLLMLINWIESEVEAKEMIIHVLVEMGFIEARRNRFSMPPRQKGVILLLLGWNGQGPRSPPSPPPTFLHWACGSSSSISDKCFYMFHC